MRFLRDLIFPGGFMPHGCTTISLIALAPRALAPRGVDWLQFRETVNTLGQYWLRVNLAPPRERARQGTGESE
jgi:hypothetical protein